MSGERSPGTSAVGEASMMGDEEQESNSSSIITTTTTTTTPSSHSLPPPLFPQGRYIILPSPHHPLPPPIPESVSLSLPPPIPESVSLSYLQRPPSNQNPTPSHPNNITSVQQNITSLFHSSNTPVPIPSCQSLQGLYYACSRPQVPIPPPPSMDLGHAATPPLSPPTTDGVVSRLYRSVSCQTPPSFFTGGMGYGNETAPAQLNCNPFMALAWNMGMRPTSLGMVSGLYSQPPALIRPLAPYSGPGNIGRCMRAAMDTLLQESSSSAVTCGEETGSSVAITDVVTPSMGGGGNGGNDGWVSGSTGGEVI